MPCRRLRIDESTQRLCEEKADPCDRHREKKSQPVQAFQHIAKPSQPSLYLRFGQLGNDEIGDDSDECRRKQQNGQRHALYHTVSGKRSLCPTAEKTQPARDKKMLSGG